MTGNNEVAIFRGWIGDKPNREAHQQHFLDEPKRLEVFAKLLPEVPARMNRRANNGKRSIACGTAK